MLFVVGVRVVEGVLRVGFCVGVASFGGLETVFTWKIGWGWWFLFYSFYGAIAGIRRDFCREDMGFRGCCLVVRGVGFVL